MVGAGADHAAGQNVRPGGGTRPAPRRRDKRCAQAAGPGDLSVRVRAVMGSPTLTSAASSSTGEAKGTVWPPMPCSTFRGNGPLLHSLTQHPLAPHSEATTVCFTPRRSRPRLHAVVEEMSGISCRTSTNARPSGAGSMAQGDEWPIYHHRGPPGLDDGAGHALRRDAVQRIGDTETPPLRRCEQPGAPGDAAASRCGAAHRPPGAILRGTIHSSWDNGTVWRPRKSASSASPAPVRSWASYARFW